MGGGGTWLAPETPHCSESVRGEGAMPQRGDSHSQSFVFHFYQIYQYFSTASSYKVGNKGESNEDSSQDMQRQEPPTLLPGQQGTERGGEAKQVAEGASLGDQQGHRQGPNCGQDQHNGEGS